MAKLRVVLFTVTSQILLLLSPTPAYAHAFGTLYTLPIPLWLYLYGAGAALIISFLAIGFFAKESSKFSYPKINFKVNYQIILFIKILSLGLFLLTILSGFFGSQFSSENFAVNFFWIIFLLGFTYLTAILGNIWEIVNPWKNMVSLLEKSKPILSYPQKLGYFPALIFYFILIWLELLSGGIGVKPFSLAQILLFYTSLTFAGSLIFGSQVWFKYVEFFSVFFSLISKLSPFGNSDILKDQTKHFSLLLFIMFMLSSTAFDGFRSTTTWMRFYYSTLVPLENILGDNSYQLIQTIMLILSPLFFLTFYLIAIGLMKMLAKTKSSIKDLSLHFAYSLIPIALAYNVAHYYTLLLTQGQIVTPLILGASFVWHSEVTVIIIGHILAVFLAHMMALKILPRKQALISQIPMLILMVVFTITGLWILSQPLTVGG